MIERLEIYRLKVILLQRSRMSSYLIMINMKNIYTAAKNNTLIVIDSLFFKKKKVEETLFMDEILIILWNTEKKKFSSYLSNQIILNTFKNFFFYQKFDERKGFITAKCIDIYSSVFDLFNLFLKNCKQLVPVVIISENLWLEVISIWKVLNLVSKNLFKTSCTYKRLFIKIRRFISKKIKYIRYDKNNINRYFCYFILQFL
nr:hypothetical protein 1634Bnrm1_p113 [Cryptomonas sp.]